MSGPLHPAFRARGDSLNQEPAVVQVFLVVDQLFLGAVAQDFSPGRGSDGVSRRRVPFHRGPESRVDVGAGLVSITVSNQSADPATLTLSGPNDITTGQIQPGDTASVKGELGEGEYDVSAGDESVARGGTLTVGPERPSSQNDLLLP